MLRGKSKENAKHEDSKTKTKTREKHIHIPTIRIIRFLFQLLFFVLLNAGLFQLASLAFPIPIIPVLSSSAAPGVTAISAFDALQYGLSATIPVLLGAAIAVFLLSAILIGKGFCAFVCPFGFAQDLVGYLRRPLGVKEFTLSTKNIKTFTRLKYYIAGVVLLIAAVVGVVAAGTSRTYATEMFGIFSDVPFAVLSPADTLFATLPELIILGKPWVMGWSFILWLRVIILGISLVFAFIIPRAFCRYICPISALMAPLNRYTIIGLERNPVKCTGERCRLCEKACPMDVPIFSGQEKRFSRHPECIMCLVCKDVCENSAIRFAAL
jgi:ferredoxin-type protein NapH